MIDAETKRYIDLVIETLRKEIRAELKKLEDKIASEDANG